jgi:glycosyltransferase involved in cell wall biosynthesis
VKTEILFFVPEWPALDSSILHAQVLSVASFLNQEGFSCRFAGAETSPARAQEAAAVITAQYGVQAYVAPVLSPHAGAWNFWRSCWRVYDQMLLELADAAITHVYARSFIGSMWARRLARKLDALSIFDVRAVVSQEHQLVQGSSLKSWVSSYLELQESRRADRLSTVSENLQKYLSRETGRHDMTVIPSCFNENSFYFDPAARTEIRNALDLNNNSILLCYSGGTSAWQRIADIISLLKGVCSADARCKALFLTTSQDEVTRRLKETQFPPGQAFVQGCSHKEVHRYLSAADVGFIMRHDTIVNNVASPVKVGEYLACGLPVILTRGIGDYSDMLPAAGVGILLDEDADTVEQVLRFISRYEFVGQKNAVIRFAKSRLTMSANLDHYRSLYAGRQANRLPRC